MADIFISYARADRGRIEPLARALKEAGFTVWWDTNIRGGARFATEITRELSEADVAIVAWSQASIISEWVLDEAAQARNENKLVPISLDDIKPPLGFRQRQAIDFKNWNGKPQELEFAALVQSVKAMQSGEAAEFNMPASRKIANKKFSIGAVLLSIGLFAGIVLFLFLNAPKDASVAANTFVVSEFDTFDGSEESSRFSRRFAEALERTLTVHGITLVRTNGANTDSAGEFAINGTIEKNEKSFVAELDVTHNLSGQLIWSYQINLPINTEQFEISDTTSIFAAVSKCFVFNRARMNNDIDPTFLMALMRTCEAERTGGELYGQMQELAKKLTLLRPQYANSNSYYAAMLAWFSLHEGVPSELRRLQEETYEYARRALAIDPNDGQAYWALAVVQDESVGFADREKYFREMYRRDPANITPRRHYAHFLRNVGRFREAANQYGLISEAEPLYAENLASLIRTKADMGNIAEARYLLAEALEKWPYDHNVRRAALYIESWYGDPDEAVNYVQERNLRSSCLVAFFNARRNNTMLATEELNQACEVQGLSNPLNYYAYFGHVDFIFGLSNEQIALYMPTNGMPTRDFLFVAYSKDIRSEPRFMTFAERIGLVDYWLETDQWPDFCAEQKDLPYDCKAAALAAKNTTN